MSSPAGATPAVPTGPFIDPAKESLPPRAVLLVAPVTTFFILAIICIGLRLWAKRIKKISLRFTDYAIIVAAVFSAGYLSICWLVAKQGGVGFPLVQVAPPQRTLTQKSFIVAWLLQAWANTFVRLSILDFIAQVFSVKKFRMVVYFFEGCAIAYLVGCTITFFAICRPIKYNWEVGPAALQHCGNLSMKFLLSSIFNLTLDVCILVLPMPMLWTLQLNSRKKIALTVVFGLGIFVCFATAWRTYNVVHFSTPEAKLNFTMTVVDDALWSGLEINLGIINACLPVMPAALQRIFKIPFLRLISFSTWRPASGSEASGLRPTWMRLGSTKGDKNGSISRKVEYSVDVEANPMGHIPMENMGSTTKLADNQWPTYQYTATNQYHPSGKPQGLPEQYVQHRYSQNQYPQNQYPQAQ
ncbi:uncharacterized protein F4817DRAFT_348677 [Daldinia loculata]|uniref:uncharacterized protein n=1 Tax=Daldinia loculata TaxID=103429 RepID=UPI0020C3DAA2|nr:uncharacterized protein F4817DRAFT_348677 [Daldinia loculata]KAI1643796.1 hypothetical protein F4817DRAFT_348677 [Daldinia loculata]